MNKPKEIKEKLRTVKKTNPRNRRRVVSFNIETKVWTWLKTQAKEEAKASGATISVSRFLNKVLADLRAETKFSPVQEDTVNPCGKGQEEPEELPRVAVVAGEK
jgi:hypothetical protein